MCFDMLSQLRFHKQKTFVSIFGHPMMLKGSKNVTLYLQN